MSADAAKISGPRDDHDLSHNIWQGIKQNSTVDYEVPVNVSAWRQDQSSTEREYVALEKCTKTRD